jgi:hypothetical protein
MDNVRNLDSYINIPSSQTYGSKLQIINIFFKFYVGTVQLLYFRYCIDFCLDNWRKHTKYHGHLSYQAPLGLI